jgi:hypothetical protein
LKSRPDLGELNTNFLLARDVILENLNPPFSVGFAACEAILRHTGFQLPLNLDLHQTHRTDAMLYFSCGAKLEREAMMRLIALAFALTLASFAQAMPLAPLHQQDKMALPGPAALAQPIAVLFIPA